jgi:hypothetical protein
LVGFVKCACLLVGLRVFGCRSVSSAPVNTLVDRPSLGGVLEQATGTMLLERNSSSGSGERGNFDVVTELGEPSDEAAGLRLLATAVEVLGSEVLVDGAVLQHVIDGGED